MSQSNFKMIVNDATIFSKSYHLLIYSIIIFTVGIGIFALYIFTENK